MFEASYYDGAASRCHRVTVTGNALGLTLSGMDVERSLAWRDIDLDSYDGHGRRIVSFFGGGQCDVDDGVAFTAWLETLGRQDSRVARAERVWPAALGAFVLMAGVLAGGYVWGVPWVADKIAHHLPDTAVTRLSDESMSAISRLARLEASALPAPRRESLSARFMALKPDTELRWMLHFRQGGRLQANALALPSGDIIVTDELVALAKGDDALILAVLAHEAGHVAARHGLRSSIQTTLVGILAGWLTGDPNAVIAQLAAAGLGLEHSRQFEFEADAYGAELLQRHGMSPSLLADMLEKLEGTRVRDPAQGDEDSDRLKALLSTHPATRERIARLRAM